MIFFVHFVCFVVVSMRKKFFLVGIVVLLVYLLVFNAVTSRIVFSERSWTSKAGALAEYGLTQTAKGLWWLGCKAFELLQSAWYTLKPEKPTYDIKNSSELYHLYKEVERWSGLPWQVFWGLHSEETALGKNLGTIPILSVLPKEQLPYFYQICRELHWDPKQVYGSNKGAIGPFQFIPETWVRHAVDANGDGRKDPFDVEDAAFSAANYLLYKGGQANLSKAVWHYNQDQQYVKRVMQYLKYS